MNLFDTLHWGDMIPPQLYVTSVLTKQSQNSPHKSPLGDCWGKLSSIFMQYTWNF